MPTYPEIRTYKSGFYNNRIINGVNDRVYNSNDMTKFYTGLFTNGVKPDEDGTLGNQLAIRYITAMRIQMVAGDGLFNSRFFTNESAFVITLDPITNATRYDCVIIRSDTTDAVRDTTVYIKSLDHVPTISDLTRSANVKEYCLGYITVPANAESISQASITDTRSNNDLCGLITGAFNQFDSGELYNQFTAAFNEWFNEVRNYFVANATLVHTYYNEAVSTSVNQRIINIGIPQYIKNTDVLMVRVNGLSFTEGINYTVNDNNQITLTIGLPVVGTKIEFQVLKSVDGSQAQTVVSQVNTLINQMNVVNRFLECDYQCNGTNDNVLISQLVATFIDDTSLAGDAQLLIRVHGTCGVSSKYSGDNWFVAGGTTINIEKRVIIDFADCSKVVINMAANTENNIFFGVNYTIKNLNLVASGYQTGCKCTVHASVTGEIYCENCRVKVIVTGDAIYAREGTHINCEVYISSSLSFGICFYPTTSSKPLVVISGEYRAYTASTSNIVEAAVFYTQSVATNAVIVIQGVNCPTVAVSSFYQKNCLKVHSGYVTASGLITALTNYTTGSTASITGTIPLSKS